MQSETQTRYLYIYYITLCKQKVQHKNKHFITRKHTEYHGNYNPKVLIYNKNHNFCLQPIACLNKKP